MNNAWNVESRVIGAGTIRRLFVLALGSLAIQAAMAGGFKYRLLHSMSSEVENGITNQLTLGTDGSLYYTVSQGGTDARGAAFRMTPRGAVTTIYQFPGASQAGSYPVNLSLNADGDFYGATTQGPPGWGAVFRMPRGGQVRVLNSLPDSHGLSRSPITDLAIDGGDLLFGLFYPDATVFQRMSAKGKVLSTVTADAVIGHAMASAHLARGADRNWYGVTRQGGANGLGTVYRVSPVGVASVLLPFSVDGPVGYPAGQGASVTAARDGALYLVTTGGAANGLGAISRVTLDGAVTVLHDFATADDIGYGVQGPLLSASDGRLYGASSSGGAGAKNGARGGTVFRLSLDGTLKVIRAFGDPDTTQGDGPYGTLTEAPDGSLYGIVRYGAGLGLGGLYRLTPK